MKKAFYVLSLALLALVFTSCKGGKKEKNDLKEIPELKPVAVSGMHQDTVEFPSGDGLMMAAVIYEIDSTSPVVVMCHQARMSNYEYAEIAPKLNQMGYNCIALDLRSGGTMETHENITFNHAKEKNLPTGYLDSEQDILAGLNYAYERWHQPVILWGSSFSAGLCLKIGTTNDKVREIIAYSPGEYYEGKMSLKESIQGLNKPTYITSTEKEAAAIEKIISDIPAGVITQYFPDMKGTHGSKALWSTDQSSGDYWESITEWIGKNK